MWNEIEKVAREVYAGKYGNGSHRKRVLTEMGYDYDLVQDMVDYLFYGGPKPSIEEAEKTEDNNEDETLYVDVNLNLYKKLVLRFV